MCACIKVARVTYSTLLSVDCANLKTILVNCPNIPSVPQTVPLTLRCCLCEEWKLEKFSCLHTIFTVQERFHRWVFPDWAVLKWRCNRIWIFELSQPALAAWCIGAYWVNLERCWHTHTLRVDTHTHAHIICNCTACVCVIYGWFLTASPLEVGGCYFIIIQKNLHHYIIYVQPRLWLDRKMWKYMVL